MTVFIGFIHWIVTLLLFWNWKNWNVFLKIKWKGTLLFRDHYLYMCVCRVHFKFPSGNNALNEREQMGLEPFRFGSFGRHLICSEKKQKKIPLLLFTRNCFNELNIQLFRFHFLGRINSSDSHSSGRQVAPAADRCPCRRWSIGARRDMLVDQSWVFLAGQWGPFIMNFKSN